MSSLKHVFTFSTSFNRQAEEKTQDQNSESHFSGMIYPQVFVAVFAPLIGASAFAFNQYPHKPYIF